MSNFTADDLRRYPTVTEKRLWQCLRASQLDGHRFRRQHPIGRCIVDFVCLRKKLIVELDGLIHEKRKEYDERRDQWLRTNGFEILRFTNEEWNQNPEQVLTVIKNSLQKRLNRW